jgi:ubiquinone/menaquinone biosynthesis C-methylase UbiE
VLREVARVLRPHGVLAITFSNRCFPTKAIRGWLATDDEQHCTIVTTYIQRAGGFTNPMAQLRTPRQPYQDPLYAVVAQRATA